MSAPVKLKCDKVKTTTIIGDEDISSTPSFESMGLDDRILQAIAWLGWRVPSLIQEKAIPLALEGKDILARARTGSGKTGAMVIPILDRILKSKKLSEFQQHHISAVILAPTKELCAQMHENFQDLSRCCLRNVSFMDISDPSTVDSNLLSVDRPDCLIGTPKQVLDQVTSGNVDLSRVKMICIDEADLTLSFGQDGDIRKLTRLLPKVYQAFLMSATLNAPVKALKQLLLHRPVILKLKESQLPTASQLAQFHIACVDDEERFLVLCALLKLRLLQGRSIIFANSVSRCYKLKLFLDSFHIKCCLLNSELPINCRCKIMSDYNNGAYDYIIATDEAAASSLTPATKKPKDKKRKQRRDYGVSRGIDFRNVTNVVNFDFPDSVDNYVHRVGRTARGDNPGSALSFTLPEEKPLLTRVDDFLRDQPQGQSIRAFKFKMNEIEGFRYRVQEALQSVGPRLIHKVRVAEIKEQMLNSQRLKAYFSQKDVQILRHDRSLLGNRGKNLHHVPDYLVPSTLKRKFELEEEADEEIKKMTKRKQRYKKPKKDDDPLKTIKVGDKRL